MPRQRVDAQPAYVLHTYPFRETSLIAEVLTRDFGRIALLARGARRPRAAIRGLLMSFQPLELGWAGKAEVLTLMKAEWQGGVPLLAGEALFCGYYLNELLMHLLPREDAHPELFAHYGAALATLAASGGKGDELALRRFEKALLQELGYGLTLNRDALGATITPDGYYRYEIERGAVPLGDTPSNGMSILGKTLLDLDADTLDSTRSRQESKQLMRVLLSWYLNGKELETRKVFKGLAEL